MMNEATNEFDRLLDILDGATGSRPDAIERVLSGMPRRTETRSLRGNEVVVRFREDLTNGLIRVDTTNQVFRLLREVIVRVLG